MHIALHIVVPLVVALTAYRGPGWWRSYALLLAGLVADVDHLLAEPIYDAMRCSIGYHPLHGTLAIAFYTGLTAWRQTRIFGLGLLIHMALDAFDCGLIARQNPGA